MPITQSAKKALRNSLRKKSFNGRRKKSVDEASKVIKKLQSTDKKEGVKLLSLAYKAIDKAAKAGTLSKNTAARKKSRLAMMVKKATAK